MVDIGGIVRGVRVVVDVDGIVRGAPMVVDVDMIAVREVHIVMKVEVIDHTLDERRMMIV